jgi:hypothetical protein
VLGIGVIVALATRVADALLTLRRETTRQRQARSFGSRRASAMGAMIERMYTVGVRIAFGAER